VVQEDKAVDGFRPDLPYALDSLAESVKRSG